MADTDWLKDHINEVVLPNLINDIHELTGIQLDDSINEFKVIATALDPEDESSEEFEITIHYGEVCLVDACFLVEEIEAGSLPLCLAPEELTESLIQGALDQLRRAVVPALREEFAQELAQHDFDPKLAHLLDIVPEVIDSGSGLRSSGGYPPVALYFRHPDHDPDTFEVMIRIDPLAKSDWIHWKSLMPKLEEALRAIGEEPTGAAAARDGRPAAGRAAEDEPEPTAADLEDPEIGEIEVEADDTEAVLPVEEEAVPIVADDDEEAEAEEELPEDDETFGDDDEDGGKKSKGKKKDDKKAAAPKTPTKAPGKPPAKGAKGGEKTAPPPRPTSEKKADKPKESGKKPAKAASGNKKKAG